MAIDDLYQEILLDHYKAPRNKGCVENADLKLELKNPFCGDEILLTLKFDGNRVKEVAFEGNGCVISQASASLMTEKIKGLEFQEIESLIQRFTAIVKEGGHEHSKSEELDELDAFQGICEFPTRVKCALLAWRTLEQALQKYKNNESINRTEKDEKKFINKPENSQTG